MNIDFNEKELKAIDELSTYLSLPKEKVLIQALRLYQMAIFGYCKIIKTTPTLLKVQDENHNS